ncbi:MAG: acetylglutamate kinase [Oligosphaeraceae bacterium]|nr:acetylglutamate kinase [Oligosphaeraceae bacterium]
MQQLIAKADVLVEALPYIQKFRGQSILIKFGGSVMEEPAIVESALRDIAFLAAAGLQPLLVHGGGKAISAELKKQGIEPVFINGLRYTCEKTIRVVDQVLHEKINWELLRFLQQECGAETAAVSGKNVLRCERINTTDKDTGETLDLGYVGKVVNVDTQQLGWILERRQIPVITPLACDMSGQPYNINADMAACVIAAQMKVCKLVFLSDVPGVLRDPADPASLISSIYCEQIPEMAQQGIISGGMLPKLESAAQAIADGVGKVHLIDGRMKHALLLEIFTDQGIGTQILKEPVKG